MKPSFLIHVGALAVVAGTTCMPAIGQTPGQRLQDAYALERDGKPAQSVSAAQSLLDAHVLDAFETGKTWNILGLAYEDEDQLQLARHAYEEAIRILEPLPNVRDYAMALDGLGGVYVTLQQFDAADMLRTKALEIYKKTGDHAGIARSATDLALSAYRQNRVSKGNEYLARALKEARLATDLDNDDRAAILSLQGWKAWHDGDFSGSATRYRQALKQWSLLHGEDHPTTAWGHVLLGDAEASAGHLTAATMEIKTGLDILDRSVGHQNRHFLLAQLAYARVLEATGSRAEAGKIKAAADSMLQESNRRQCMGCSISAMALR